MPSPVLRLATCFREKINTGALKKNTMQYYFGKHKNILIFIITMPVCDRKIQKNNILGENLPIFTRSQRHMKFVHKFL